MLEVIIQPDEEPVTLQEVKDHLKIDYNDDDNLLTGLAKTARLRLERKLNLAFMSQTLEETFACTSNALRLSRSPVIDVYEITMEFVRNGVTDILTVDPDLYVRRGNVIKSRGGSWSFSKGQELTVTYVAGYDDADSVPEDLKHALKCYVAYLYENRGDASAEPPAFVWQMCKDYYTPTDMLLF